jgi:hypothetical protein
MERKQSLNSSKNVQFNQSSSKSIDSSSKPISVGNKSAKKSDENNSTSTCDRSDLIEGKDN